MRENVRVIHLTSVHAHNDVRIFSKECVSLASHGFDVTLIAPGTDDHVETGVRILGVPRVSGRLRRMFLTSLRIYRRARSEKADIYHFHDPELLPWGLLLKFRGHKVIYDAHEDVPRQILSKFWIHSALRWVISWGFEKLEIFISKQLDGVVAATPHISERFSRINQNTVNVNNYPLPYELAPPADAYERRNQVCYVGGLSRIRGIKPLIEALEFIPGIRLVLCGQFSDRSFESELRLLHGWGQVDYRGQVERPEVRVVMSESIAGVLTYFPEPNHIEAQPNKLFEYMSAGLPVIASDFPHWRQIIDGVGAGQCVDPKSPEAIAGAIQELMNQPEIAAKMGKAGRQAVMERYNWPTEADKLITYYKGLL